MHSMYLNDQPTQKTHIGRGYQPYLAVDMAKNLRMELENKERKKKNGGEKTGPYIVVSDKIPV